MSEEIKKTALEWLTKQGYPLEMKVAKKFQDCEFRVFSSVIFEDSNKKIGREIDIVAMRSIPFEMNTVLNITFLVECKYSIDKPWIFFKSSPKSYYNKKYDILYKNSSEHAKIILLELENINSELKENFLFTFKNGLYYGTKRVHEDKKSMTHEAVSKVCNALTARTQEINKNNSFIIFDLEIQFPLIIVQGNLFESFLNEEAEILLNEIEYGRLFISNPEFGGQFYIDVVFQLFRYLYAVNFVRH